MSLPAFVNQVECKFQPIRVQAFRTDGGGEYVGLAKYFKLSDGKVVACGLATQIGLQPARVGKDVYKDRHFACAFRT